MNLVLVHNPKSGSARSASELKDLFKNHGITIDLFIPMNDSFESNLKQHVKKGQIIAAIGGDGTLSAVANVLTGTDAIFAPLSGGTLNHFTKDLGVAQDLDEALKRLAKKKINKIDVASINGTVFINNSSIGLYPSSLNTRERFEDRLGKWPAAVVGSLRALWRYRTYTVSIEGKEFKTPFIFVGNNDYHLDQPDSGGRTRLDRGVLSVYAIKSASRFAVVKLLGHALIGQLNNASEIETWKTNGMTISSKKTQLRVSRDGELEKLETPLHYKIIAGKLRIIGS